MFLIVSTFVTLLSLSTQISLVNSCPDGWSFYRNHCYRYFPDLLTWKEAEQLCQSKGNAHLVSIHSRKEFNFVYQLWKKMRADSDNTVSKVQAMWIGLTDEDVEGVFRYSDGTPHNFSGFDYGEPNDRHGDEDYVSIKDVLGYSPYWNDAKAWKTFQIMCKRTEDGPTGVSNIVVEQHFQKLV